MLRERTGRCRVLGSLAESVLIPVSAALQCQDSACPRVARYTSYMRSKRQTSLTNTRVARPPEFNRSSICTCNGIIHHTTRMRVDATRPVQFSYIHTHGGASRLRTCDDTRSRAFSCRNAARGQQWIDKVEDGSTGICLHK